MVSIRLRPLGLTSTSSLYSPSPFSRNSSRTPLSCSILSSVLGSAPSPSVFFNQSCPSYAHSQIRTAIANFRPKKLAHKKAFKGFYRLREGGSLRGTTLYHGDYGLQVIEGGRLFDRQLDAARHMIRRTLKSDKGSKFFLRQFPHRPVTSKGSETRMGKGKGVVEHFATWVRPGSLVFEILGARKETAHQALRAAAGTLPLRTRIIKANSELRVAPRCLPYFIQKRIDQAEFLAKI